MAYPTYFPQYYPNPYIPLQPMYQNQMSGASQPTQSTSTNEPKTQNGGFIPGIRAGKPTTEYLKKVSNRITLFGAIFLAFMALIPTLLFTGIGLGGLNSAFSATGMLIVVSVALEFDKQLEAQLMMKNYRGFLKQGFQMNIILIV